MKNQSLDLNEVLTCIYKGVRYFEEWKPVNNYEEEYEVSSFGRVKSLLRYVNVGNGKRSVKEKILKSNIYGRGYLHIRLFKNCKGETVKIHHLVAASFYNHIRNGFEGLIVDHDDNDKLNNFYKNIKLITPRENSSKDKKGCTSEYTGVSWNKAANKWQSTIRVNSELKHLGYFLIEKEASDAYQIVLKNLIK